jgi:hypothetical protein
VHPGLVHFVAEWADINYAFKVKKIMNAINDRNIEVLDGELKQLREDNERLQETFREEKWELQNNFRKVKEDLIDRMVRIREEKEELEGTIEDLSEEKKELEGTIEDLSEEKKNLEAKMQEEKEEMQSVIVDLSDKERSLQITIKNKCVVGDDNKILKIVRGKDPKIPGKENIYFVSANNSPTLTGSMKGGKVIVKYVFAASMNVRKLVKRYFKRSDPAPRFKEDELEAVKEFIMNLEPKDVFEYE